MRMVLFGSRARGAERPDSDWDIAVLLDTHHPDWWVFAQRREWELQARRRFHIPPDQAIDLFAVWHENNVWVASRLVWDNLHECLGGWLPPAARLRMLLHQARMSARKGDSDGQVQDVPTTC